MKVNIKQIIVGILCLLISVVSLAQSKKSVEIILPSTSVPRIKFGAERLQKALEAAGYNTSFIDFSRKHNRKKGVKQISLSLDTTIKIPKEGFILKANNQLTTLTASDPTGVLYGTLELADRIATTKELPQLLDITDAPEMVLRGQCIGLQKPYYLPGRDVYEYPYTPETFPWFYDKQLWVQVLDSMVNNRMNSLYLWNGHPFASLVKLKDYPYAVEVSEETFKKNEEIFTFLTQEADKRGIWVIQMFYNIIVSKPFAEKHNLKTQERERPIIPIIADYTRKSIAAFVEKYPNVGLMVCLGEAMEGVGNDDIEWFTKTIIPGVQDGLKALGKKEEPPIVLRAHDTDAPSVMKAALPLYKNLYTVAKFNGEALTYQRPRGAWAELHQTLSNLGSVHIENVHILANLEPFRYASPKFIQESVIGMHEVMGGNGLHLYPQASYWDWPYSADRVKNGDRLLQIERDWMWYKAWSRYAWKAKRDRRAEIDFWCAQLGHRFGLSKQDANNILIAYEETGEIAPKLLRRFGITDGNRQTLTLGMLMSQLINPYRFGLFELLYECEAPEGEMLITYADKEWNGVPHVGETPVQVIQDVKDHADKAVKAIDAVAAKVSTDKEEFERIRSDVYAYKALAYHFAYKAQAALYVLRYKYSEDLTDLEKALPLLEKSVAYYKELAQLTKETYLYANSMQTQQRKIPLRGANGNYKHWTEVLLPFEKELSHFKHKLDSLKNNNQVKEVAITPLKNAPVKLQGDYSWYTIDSLAQPFVDTLVSIKAYSKELKGLKGVQMKWASQIKNGTSLTFTVQKPVKVLVGFFQPQRAAFKRDTTFLKAPELETNASANDYGQAETKIANAIVIPGLPQLHIHSYDFKAGTNTLKLANGVALILGFIDAEAPLQMHDAGLYESGNRKQVDWLFE